MLESVDSEYRDRVALVRVDAAEDPETARALGTLAVPLLVGLGIGELSGTPRSVPVVKEIVRALDSGEVGADARRALAAGTVAEVEIIACERLEKAGLLEHPDIGVWLAEVVTRTRGEK